MIAPKIFRPSAGSDYYSIGRNGGRSKNFGVVFSNSRSFEREDLASVAT